VLAFVYGYWEERGKKNLRVFKFSVQETRLEKSVGFQTDPVPSSSLLRDYN